MEEEWGELTQSGQAFCVARGGGSKFLGDKGAISFLSQSFRTLHGKG